MRTNIEIEDTLMKDALRLSGIKTKRSVVEAALHLLVQLKQQEKMKHYRGKLHWEGNLDKQRSDR